MFIVHLFSIRLQCDRVAWNNKNKNKKSKYWVPNSVLEQVAENMFHVSITLVKLLTGLVCIFFFYLQPTSVILSSARQQSDKLVSSLRRGGDIRAWKYDLGQQEAAEVLAWGGPNTYARTWRSHERPFHVGMRKKESTLPLNCKWEYYQSAFKWKMLIKASVRSFT